MARELGVRTALIGQIVQRGDDLNISVELVDARTNSHLWGEQYERKVADIFVLQKEIARDISDKLGMRLTGEELKHANKDYTKNTEAFQLYSRGRYFWNKRTPEDLQRAADYFQQAIAQGPELRPRVLRTSRLTLLHGVCLRPHAAQGVHAEG